jgi:hypothetical protein
MFGLGDIIILAITFGAWSLFGYACYLYYVFEKTIQS